MWPCTAISRQQPHRTLRRATLAQSLPIAKSLSIFPHRGTMRDDVRPGLRITNYKKRAVIAFDVTADLVSIIGVFYGGQDYEAILHEDNDDDSVFAVRQTVV